MTYSWQSQKSYTYDSLLGKTTHRPRPVNDYKKHIFRLRSMMSSSGYLHHHPYNLLPQTLMVTNLTSAKCRWPSQTPYMFSTTVYDAFFRVPPSSSLYHNSTTTPTPGPTEVVLPLSITMKARKLTTSKISVRVFCPFSRSRHASFYDKLNFW